MKILERLLSCLRGPALYIRTDVQPTIFAGFGDAGQWTGKRFAQWTNFNTNASRVRFLRSYREDRQRHLKAHQDAVAKLQEDVRLADAAINICDWSKKTGPRTQPRKDGE